MRQLKLSPEELKGLTPLGARDLVVRCFCAAQHETLSRASQSLSAVPSEESLNKMMIGVVRLAFRAVNADFEKPTRDALMNVVGQLASQAASMGTPPDVIAHHRAQLGKVFAALSEAA
jgi:hypothetical protein